VWTIGVGFPGVATEWTKVEILRFLEQVAAFTLLGYMTAEFRGRAVASYHAALPRLLRWGAVAVLAGEGVRGLHVPGTARRSRGGPSCSPPCSTADGCTISSART
jgi:hypothetical protein